MGMPVVTVAAGGLPVVDVGAIAPLCGVPVTEAANGRGVAVTKVVGKPGLPVIYTTTSGAVVSPNTFSTTDKSASVNLSLGNLKATMGVSANGGVRSMYGQSGGKFYFEFTLGSNFNLMIGIATATASLTSGNPIGMFVVIPVSGGVNYNNASTGISFGALSVGNVVCAAIDLVNNRGWFRINGGNWNNNVANDPTTNVGGVNISSLFAGAAAFVVFQSGVSGTNATVNFGTTAFAQSIPSGFSAGPVQPG